MLFFFIATLLSTGRPFVSPGMSAFLFLTMLPFKLDQTFKRAYWNFFSAVSFLFLIPTIGCLLAVGPTVPLSCAAYDSGAPIWEVTGFLSPVPFHAQIFSLRSKDNIFERGNFIPPLLCLTLHSLHSSL